MWIYDDFVGNGLAKIRQRHQQRSQIELIRQPIQAVLWLEWATSDLPNSVIPEQIIAKEMICGVKGPVS